MTLTIRDATSEDAHDLLRIYNREVLEGVATFDVEPRTLVQQRAWLEQRSGGHVVVVAEVHEDDVTAVAGFGSLSKYKERAAYSTTVENSVYVDPGFQRRGVGRALMTELIDRARLHGFHTMIARIAGNNEGSVLLHQQVGFELVGVEREVGRKFGRWLDLTEMQLML